MLITILVTVLIVHGNAVIMAIQMEKHFTIIKRLHAEFYIKLHWEYKYQTLYAFKKIYFFIKITGV